MADVQKIFLSLDDLFILRGTFTYHNEQFLILTNIKIS